MRIYFIPKNLVRLNKKYVTATSEGVVLVLFYYPYEDQIYHHLKTSHLINRANQLNDFSIMARLTCHSFNGLHRS